MAAEVPIERDQGSTTRASQTPFSSLRSIIHLCFQVRFVELAALSRRAQQHLCKTKTNFESKTELGYTTGIQRLSTGS